MLNGLFFLKVFHHFAILNVRLFVMALCALGSVMMVEAQNPSWTVISPEPNSIISNENLFVYVALSPDKKFDPKDIRVLLDKVPLNVIVKTNENKLSFVYLALLTDGTHNIDIWANVSGEASIKQISWKFHVNFMDDSLVEPVKAERRKITMDKKSNWSLTGNITADNRNEELTGSGRGLRQEPDYTRTIGVNLSPRYKEMQLSIKYFNVSNHPGFDKFYDATQNQNFFQIGFQNESLDLAYGDINPSMDKLILTGVRLKGYKVKLHAEEGFLEVFYGDMSPAIEGSTIKYSRGDGSIPPNLVNDSTAMVPGNYRRTLAAVRFEKSSSRDTYKFGINALKIKDDVESIIYGVAPKDNVAASFDLGLRLFKKTLAMNLGIAASAITNDITNGPITKAFADSTFNIDLPFNPLDHERQLVLNSSTVPINPFKFSYLAYYGQMSFTEKFHSTSLEYTNNGPNFYSLGNPFLRNNYKGFNASEKVSLWKRRINLYLNYQNYKNNINQTLVSDISTSMYNATLFFNYGSKLPTVMFNYMFQNRNSENGIVNSATLKDQLQFYTLNINYYKTFWKMDHNFRLLYTAITRDDLLRVENKTSFSNIMLGIGERFYKTFSLSIDGGKTLVYDAGKKKLSDFNSYSGTLDWRNKSQKFHASFSATNNTTIATILSNQTSRVSLVVRSGIKFWHRMALDLEYGYQPFHDTTTPENNYGEQYFYARYSFDIDTRSR
jgi:hypothetical protein